MAHLCLSFFYTFLPVCFQYFFPVIFLIDVLPLKFSIFYFPDFFSIRFTADPASSFIEVFSFTTSYLQDALIHLFSDKKYIACQMQLFFK